MKMRTGLCVGEGDTERKEIEREKRERRARERGKKAGRERERRGVEVYIFRWETVVGKRKTKKTKKKFFDPVSKWYLY